MSTRRRSPLGRMAAAASMALAGSTASAPALSADSAHAFSFTGITGEPLPLDQFAGKVVLVVNTASKCGFTPQYEGLQALWQRYRERGLVVLGVPSNDFGGQEPGSDAEIQSFCAVNFDIDFPMTAKTVVSGGDAHPFYAWARDQAGFIGSPKWNFHKYLIDPEGRFVSWFSSVTGPDAARLIKAIEEALPPVSG